MTAAELLADGDFANAAAASRVTVVARAEGHPSRQWFLSPGPDSAQPPVVLPQPGYMRLAASRGARLRQALATPERDVVLRAAVRVVSGELLIGAVEGNRPGPTAEVRADSGWQDIDLAVPGQVDQVVLYAAADSTVIDVKRISLTHNGQPAPAVASPVPAGCSESPPSQLDTLLTIAVPDADARRRVQPELDRPAASLTAIAAAFARQGAADNAAAVGYLRDVVAVAGSDVRLVAGLQQQRPAGARSAAPELTGYTVADWQTVLASTHPEMTPAQRTTGAQALGDAAQAAFPSAALIAAARADTRSSLHKPELLEFFDTHPGIDLLTSALRSLPALQGSPRVRADLERIQRLARVSAKPAHVDVLNKAGYGSAGAVARKGRAAFVSAHAAALGGEPAATEVFERAALISSRAMAVYAQHSPTFNRAMPRVLAAAGDAETAIPDWRALFGDALDLVTDDPARSVYSPAAYLADLLHFLDRQTAGAAAGGSAQTGLDVLTLKRPDLLRLALDQANTDVELPMIDLVNELLECAVLAENSTARQPQWCTSAPPAGSVDTGVGAWVTATVTDTDPAPWGAAGAAYHQTPAAAGYHAHGFTVPAGQTGLQLAPADMIGVWVRPHPDTPPSQVVLTVTTAGTPHLLIWGYPANDSQWTPGGAPHLQAGPLPPLGQWSLVILDAGVGAAQLTGLEFGCVDGAVDWGPAGSYPAAPPMTTSGTSDDRRKQPQAVRDQAYDAIAADTFPWSSTPLDLGFRTGAAALTALGVSFAEMLGAFTAPDRAAELTDASIAVTKLGIGPELHSLLTGTDGGTEAGHWGLTGDGSGNWFQQLLHAEEFLSRAGLTAAQMRTPPGAVCSRGLALLPTTDPGAGDLELVIGGLTEFSLPRLRRFLRLWRAVGGDYGPLERFYHSFAEPDPVDHNPDINDDLLARLALAQDTATRLGTDLLTITTWWTALLDAGGYADPAVYPADGPGSIANSPYSRIFLDQALGDAAATFGLDDDGEIARTVTITAALPAIAAALGSTAEDLTLLLTSPLSGIDPPPVGDATLTRSALSAIYRAVTFARAANLTTADFLSLRALTAIDPFDAAAPANLTLFLDASDAITSAGVSIAELDYLLAGTIRPGTDFAPSPAASAVADIVAGLTQLSPIHQVVPDPNGDVVRRELIAAGSMQSPDTVLAALDGTGTYYAPLTADPGLSEADQALLRWDDSAQELQGGALTTSERDTLLGRYTDPPIQAAIQMIYQAPRAILAAVPGLDAATAGQLLDGDLPPDQRHLQVLTALVPAVLTLLATTQITQKLASRLHLDRDLTGDLLEAATDAAGTTAMSLLLSLNAASSPGALGEAADAVRRLDKIARVCALAGLTTAQIRHALTYGPAAGWLNLLSLPTEPQDAPDFAGWQHLMAYAGLRDRLGDRNDILLSIFSAAAGTASGTADTDAALSGALAQLSDLTGWPLATLTELHQLLGLAYPDSYRDEKALLRLERAMAVVSISGADPGRIHSWTTDIGATQTGSDILAFAHARTNSNPELLQPVEDSLRRLRRDALANHLHPPARNGALDDTLLGRFLIDTQVDVGRTTTRIAAATQATQLFVQRALLDLDTQLSLTSDAQDEWAWLDSYTTWSANRQVFIYPENWLDPELRQDLTPQFSTLQAELQHGDLTNDSAETALIDYLQNLDTIGQLQGAALYQEDETDSTGTITSSTLHAIARTRSTPHRYYYRQRPGSGLWTAWEDIGVDIDGENLAAYILNRQLHLFWLQMVDQVDQPTTVPASPVPVTNLDARLAWTKRGLNGWSPKQLSSDTIKITPPPTGNDPSALFLDVRWSAPGTTVTDLTLAVRQYSPPDPPGGPYRGAGEVGTFEYSGDTNDVSTGAGAGRFGVSAPIESWITGSFANWVPGEASYQAWTVGPMLAIPWFNPANPGPEMVGVFQGIPTSRVLGATSVSLPPAAAHYAVDPYLPFFIEPPGLSLLAHPVTSQPNSEPDYEFEIAYHPYAKPFLREIARAGVPALFARSAQLEPENLPADRTPLNWAGMGPISATNEGLQETLDFDSGGYFSTYNWELFFHAPLLIAKRLSVTQRFGEAKTWLEYVFNPADRSTDPAPAKYWQTKPLYQAASDQSVEDLLKSLDGQSDSAGETQVSLWRQRPFDPDVIAVLRPSAYQKATVMAYLDNLIAWGDWHFAQQGPEDLASATQVYLFAADLLGPPPEPGPVPGPTLADPPVYCFADLRHNLDSFSDAVVELENRLAVWTAPVNTPPSFEPAPGAVLLPSLYFNVPPNERLLSYWDTVTDRLSKVRSGENLAGQAITTPAYPGVGNPGELIQAASMGATAAAAARPVYRFPTVIAKARELCADVRSLGGQLLTALEKQDAEMLAAMRSGQDLGVLRTGRAVRLSALTEATQQIAQLQAAYDVAAARQAYYAGRERYNAQELEQVTHLQTSAALQAVSEGLEALGTAFSFVPEATIGLSGAMSSPVITASVGGRELASAASLVARIAGMNAGIESHLANMAGLSGGWQRRWDDWQFQAGQASLEKTQIHAQILAAQTRQQQAQQELDEYDERLADARQVDDFLRTKYTNAELYGWMVSQMASLYSQSYQLALDAARRAEAAFRYELAPDPSTFIQPSYWNSLRSGLLAGEQLAHDLQQMEAAFLDRNTRQLETTKNVSLALAAPDALIQLRATGQCTLKIPEEWFDLDYPGHYLRRIRRVAISIPCVTGPYTGVHATLSLLSDSTRIDPALNSGRYERSGLADPRFADRYGLSESIVTSGGLNQSGAFGSGGDDRFEQFEGAGAISTWLIELPPDTNAFSLDTVTDVILHLSYTARDGGPQMRAAARAEVVVPLRQFGTVLLTGTRDFPQQWQLLLTAGGDPRTLTVPLGPDLLPGTAAPASGISRLRLYLETSTTSPITVQVTPPGATAISMDLGQNEALPGLLAGAAGFSLANLGDWTIQWPGDALSAAAPTDLLVLADYEPPARRAAIAAITPRKGPAPPSPRH